MGSKWDAEKVAELRARQDRTRKAKNEARTNREAKRYTNLDSESVSWVLDRAVVTDA